MKYKPSEIEKMLDNMVVVIDTREQQTERLQRRIEDFGCPHIRRKLDYADYSVICIAPDGRRIEVDLSRVACIERKCGSDELCGNFTKERNRFQREFERAKKDNARVYLLIEGENIERIFAGRYRSKLPPQSLLGSILSWQIRYGFQVYFCKPETTGKLIGQILRYELREYLLNAESEEAVNEQISIQQYSAGA